MWVKWGLRVFERDFSHDRGGAFLKIKGTGAFSKGWATFLKIKILSPTLTF